jgi:cell division septal protein FtsQ
VRVPAAVRNAVARGPRRASRSRIRLLALVGVVVVAVGLASTFGYRALRDSSLFAMHDVVVTGANPALTAQVQSAVRASVAGRSLLALSSSGVARAIDDVPGVHVATVDRDFPSTLRVHVWPEHPVAIAVSGHDRVIVSASGRVLATIGRRSRPPNLPHLGLPGHGVPAPGSRLANPILLAQLAAVSAIPAHFGAPVGWVRNDPARGLELELHWPHLVIRLGPAVDLKQKLRAASLVMRAYPTIAAREGLSYVDVSAPARPAVMPKTPDQTTLALVAPSAGTADSGVASTTTTTTTSSTTDTTATTTTTTPSTSTNP